MKKRRKNRRRAGVFPPGTFAIFQAMRERELERRRREREAEPANESTSGHQEAKLPQAGDQQSVNSDT